MFENMSKERKRDLNRFLVICLILAPVAAILLAIVEVITSDIISGVFAVLIIFFYPILVIFFIIFKIFGSRKTQQLHRYSNRISTPDRTAEISGYIKQRDPYFNTTTFLSYARLVYIKLASSWNIKRFDDITHLVHERIYDKGRSELYHSVVDNRYMKYENITIDECYLCDYGINSEYELLSVYLSVTMDETPMYVNGSFGNPIKGMSDFYKLTFVRLTNRFSAPATAKISAYNCPNCGAPVDIDDGDVCKHCGTKFKATDNG